MTRGNARRDWKVRLLFASLLAVSAALLPAPGSWGKAAAVDVSGTWELTVEIQQATSHPSITLKQEGEKLSGTYHGQMGDSSLVGSVRGSDIRFSVRLKFQDVSYVVTYTGTVGEDVMRGEVRFGENQSGKWSAKRTRMTPAPSRVQP